MRTRGWHTMFVLLLFSNGRKARLKHTIKCVQYVEMVLIPIIYEACAEFAWLWKPFVPPQFHLESGVSLAGPVENTRRRTFGSQRISSLLKDANPRVATWKLKTCNYSVDYVLMSSIFKAGVPGLCSRFLHYTLITVETTPPLPTTNARTCTGPATNPPRESEIVRPCKHNSQSTLLSVGSIYSWHVPSSSHNCS